MPVTLKQVTDHVIAMDEPGVARESSLAGAVRETIAALGLLINAQTGEVYNPAELGPRVVPRNDQHVRWLGGPRRYRR